MSDNTTLSTGSGGDTIRDKDRGSAKTSIIGLDIGIGGASEILMTAAALTDATANPTLAGGQCFLMGFNGTTWDRLQVDGSKFLKVDVAAALPAGTNTLGQVGLVLLASGGLTPYTHTSTADTNANNVTASPGQLYEILASNIGSAPVYVKFYDTAGTPTAGSGTIIWKCLIAGVGSSGSGYAKSLPQGLKFVNGIAFTITGSYADSDTTPLAAGQCVLNLGYN